MSTTRPTRPSRPASDELQAADVLLTRGTGFVSWAICTFDHSEVSHAALVLDADIIAEAVGTGLRTVTYAKAREDHDLVVARHLTQQAAPAPVTDVARRYLEHGERHGHEPIVLLAVLCLTRRIPLPAGGRRLVRSILDQAAATVAAMAERGRQPMFCSEFVHRCHAEARPAGPYALHIDRPAGDEALEDTLLQWGLHHAALPTLAAPVVRAAAGNADAGTARDGDARAGQDGDGDARAARAAREDAEAALGPLIAAYAGATGQMGGLPPLAAPLPGPADLADPSDEELLLSMAAFGDALHRASGKRGGADRAHPLPAPEALAHLRATATAADFVTPGDLLRSPSLTERFRQTGPGAGPTAHTRTVPNNTPEASAETVAAGLPGV